MTEDRDQYGSLLRYMRYKEPTQEVWIVDSSLPLHDAVRKNMMDQVLCQQDKRNTSRGDRLVAKQSSSTDPSLLLSTLHFSNPFVALY